MSDVSDLRIGNCLDRTHGLPSLEAKSVDHCVTDPPYTGYVVANAARGRPFGYASLDPNVRREVARQIGRLCRRWAIVFTDDRGIQCWIDDLVAAGMRFVRVGVWIKTNGTPQLSGDRPASGAEWAVIAHARGARMHWNGGGHPAVWLFPRAQSSFHATPKPEGLMTRIVDHFTDPGELICDPFAGSGTTGVAARVLGRRFIGWELDEVIAIRARARVEATREQRRMFA